MKKIVTIAIAVLVGLGIYFYFTPRDTQIRSFISVYSQNEIVVDSYCDYLRNGKTVRSKHLGKVRLIGVEVSKFTALTDSRCNDPL